jgi:hypothetical protein
MGSSSSSAVLQHMSAVFKFLLPYPVCAVFVVEKPWSCVPAGCKSRVACVRADVFRKSVLDCNSYGNQRLRRATAVQPVYICCLGPALPPLLLLVLLAILKPLNIFLVW